MKQEEAKKLIETGTIQEIQEAIDNGTLDVDDTILMNYGTSVDRLRLPLICYAMVVGRPDALELLLENHAMVNKTIKTIDTAGAEHDTYHTPLSFVVVSGWYYLFDKKLKEGPKNAKMLLEHYALPKEFHFMLTNMNDHVEEYITLLLDYGAELDAIDPEYGTVFMAAAGNPNPKVLKKLVEEAKKRLSPEEFLGLLQTKDKDGKGIDDHFDTGSQTYGYWKREGPKLIKELELKVAEEDKKPKKETLKAAGKDVQNKAETITEKEAEKTAIKNKIKDSGYDM